MRWTRSRAGEDVKITIKKRERDVFLSMTFPEYYLCYHSKYSREVKKCIEVASSKSSVISKCVCLARMIGLFNKRAGVLLNFNFKSGLFFHAATLIINLFGSKICLLNLIVPATVGALDFNFK